MSNECFYFGTRKPDGSNYPDKTCFNDAPEVPSVGEDGKGVLMEDSGLQVDVAEDFLQLQNNFFLQMHDLMDGLPGLLHITPLLQFELAPVSTGHLGLTKRA